MVILSINTQAFNDKAKCWTALPVLTAVIGHYCLLASDKVSANIRVQVYHIHKKVRPTYIRCFERHQFIKPKIQKALKFYF